MLIKTNKQSKQTISNDEILAWDNILINEGISYQDAMLCECISLEDAGLIEENEQPLFGSIKANRVMLQDYWGYNGSVGEYCDWILDGDNNHYSEE